MYSELEYILDSVSYQYGHLTSELPAYNLVAHSRFGVTNMQFLYFHIGSSVSSTEVIADDLFINLDSQVAEGYKDADVKVKLMDSFDVMVGEKSEVNAFGIAYN